MDRRAAALARHVAAQAGVVSLAQVREAGFSADAVRRRLRSGEWTRAGRGVFRVAGHPETTRSRVFALMLSLGPRATLVGTSALWWWSLRDVAPTTLEAVVPRCAEPEPRQGARVRRRDIPEGDRVTVGGVVVTPRAVSLLDGVVDLGLASGAEVVDAALVGGRTTIDALRAAQAGMTGRPGVEVVRRVLALASGGARFEAERRVHGLLREAGITGWSAEVEVQLPGYGPALLDLAFEQQRVVIEVDGWAYHRDQRAFVRDEARQNALTVAGWTVLRTNWHQIVADPQAFVDAVRAVVAARSGSWRGHAG